MNRPDRRARGVRITRVELDAVEHLTIPGLVTLLERQIASEHPPRCDWTCEGRNSVKYIMSEELTTV